MLKIMNRKESIHEYTIKRESFKHWQKFANISRNMEDYCNIRIMQKVHNLLLHKYFGKWIETYHKKVRRLRKSKTSTEQMIHIIKLKIERK